MISIYRIASMFLALFVLALPSSAQPPADHAVFLIQDAMGSIIGISIGRDGQVSEAGLVRPVMNAPSITGIVELQAQTDGGYQLFRNGLVLPIGKAQQSFTSWIDSTEAMAFEMLPDGSGGWIAHKDYIKTVGKPPQMVWPSFPIPIADLEYDSSNQRLIVLLQNGRIAICGNNQFDWFNSVLLNNDIAIDVEYDRSVCWVLTKKGRVYRLDGFSVQTVPDIPELGAGLVRDLEISPFGDGLYIMDAFGVIHALQGAPQVPSEPLALDTAVDLEIIAADKLPEWYPEGWNTQIELLPKEMGVDPAAPPKSISAYISNAENMSTFTAEIHYDPKVITLVPAEHIQVGAWWKRMMQGVRLYAKIDPSKQGVIALHSGGAFSMYEGASGEGELFKISIPAPVQPSAASTRIDIRNFVFQDASQLNLTQPAKVLNSSTIYFRPSKPVLSFSWMPNGAPLSSASITASTGHVLRADLLVEDGSRIHSVLFDLLFDNRHLHYLGMTLGDAWYDEAMPWTDFDLPSKANETGVLKGQSIRLKSVGGCKDSQDSIISIFFSVLRAGQASVKIDNLALYDSNQNPLSFDGRQAAIEAQIQ